MNYFKEWKDRLFNEESASFFKPIIKAGAWIGGLGTAIMVGGDNVPATIHTIATYMLTVGLVAGFIAASSKKNDPPTTPTV